MKEHKEEINIVTNKRFGSPLLMLLLYIIMPIAYPVYEGAITHQGIILPSIVDLIGFEIVVTLFIVIRLARDYFLIKRIYPVKINDSTFMGANKKLNKLLESACAEDIEYIEAIKVLLVRNKGMYKGK